MPCNLTKSSYFGPCVVFIRECVKAVSSRFVSCELLPFVIAYAMTLHPWKRILHGWTARRKKMCFCRSNALIPCSLCDSKINIIVLINGCFHNGPVICPRLVIMAHEYSEPTTICTCKTDNFLINIRTNNYMFL